jgi:putative DNA primase/helicase
MANHDQAPLQTTPHSKYFKHNYTTNLILDKARGCWPDILESLGINASYLKNKHGPCPMCVGKDRFRFDNKQQRGTFFCNQCGSGDGIKLLQLFHGWSFTETINRVARIIGISSDKQHVSGPTHIRYHLKNIIDATQMPQQTVPDTRRKYLLNTWCQAQVVTVDDPVDCYLKARGIELNDFPSTLRFHPQLPYYDDDRVLVGKFPAMIAMVQDQNNHGITLHRTYLGDSCKANVPKPKKLMSSIMPGASLGAAIKLYAPVDGKLALAEGIETALCFKIATHLPVWSTVSAGGMERVILPASIIEVTIAVDNDQSGRGQKSAEKLAERLLAEGRMVKRVMPCTVGYDFADLLAEKNQ